MTSDEKTANLNETVQKPGAGLNPNANAFFYSKGQNTPVEKGWEGGEDFLTNGDLKPDDAGAGFSSGDSPGSDSPPVPMVDPSLEVGAPPPDFVPDPLLGATPMVLEPQVGAGDEGEVVEPTVDVHVPPVELITSPPVIAPDALPNGFEPSQEDQSSLEGGSPGTQASDTSAVPQAEADLSSQLVTQVEYYFSRENLVQDHYLQSQMDSDQYVPISTIAMFNQVIKLTTNLDFIAQALKKSKLLQVDETGKKVRPRLNRTVLMLREIPENTPKSEVEALFDSEGCPKLVSCEFAHNGYWYITFDTDEDATKAYTYLRERRVMFRNRPVMARIKARPLVRTGGSTPFVGNKAPNQQQSEATVPYIRPQQTQYQMLPAPMSQFVNQQQVPPAVTPLYYNFPTPMMPQWPNSATATFLDPGAMLSINGFQATAIKPSTNHNRNVFHPIRNNNNRGTGRSHHRPQSISTDKVQQETRPMDRPHTNNLPTSRPSPRNNHQHSSEPLSQPPPFARSRSEGSTAGNGHVNSVVQGGVGAPTPLLPEDSLPLHLSVSSVSTGKPDASPLPLQHSKHSYDSRRGSYRRSRRNEEGSRNSRSNASQGNREGRPHEPHFELEATSFPPLPGSSNNSSSGDAPEGSKLSDVVRGNTRPNSVRATAASSGSTSTPQVVATAAAPACVADPSSVPQTPSSSAVTQHTAVSAVISPVAKETEVSANGNLPSHPVNSASASATAVDSSVNTSRSSKTCSQQSSPAVAKAAAEAPVVCKSASVTSTPAKQAPAATPVTALDSVPPARLSYAQMVARKQQAENAASASVVEEGTPAPAPVAAATRPPTQPPSREASQAPATASASALVSASIPAKSASASATTRPPSRESQRRDFEPKEPRFQGARRPRDNREINRQPRFDRRRGERDVKVTAK